jgi:hypothetical protein
MIQIKSLDEVTHLLLPVVFLNKGKSERVFVFRRELNPQLIYPN